jgi:transcriptional regulator with XRE-family HTH domain
MIISGRQIRAARGLLGWSMEDLAQKADVTTVTVRNIESDAVQPQEKTLASILTCFDKQGVEFQDDEGVKIRKQQVRTYSGKAGYRQFLDHVYETLQDGGRIRQFNFGDMRYLPYTDNFVDEHLKRMEEVEGLDARVLALEEESDVTVGYCSYRYLPKQFGTMAPWYLYNDYLVMSLNETGNKREFISIHSKLLAERYVLEFDIFWEMAKEPRRKRIA